MQTKTIKKVEEHRYSELQLRRYETKIEPYLSKIAIEMSRGGTIEEMASLVEMTNETFMKYRRCFPELNTVIEAGKSESIEVAEDSLSRLAEGYYYKEIQEDQHPKTYEVMKRKVIRKYHHPDFKAVMAILLNRAPEKWSKNPDSSNPNSNIGIVNNVEVSDNIIDKALSRLKLSNTQKDTSLEIDSYIDNTN